MNFSRLPELKTEEIGNLPEGEGSKKLSFLQYLNLEQQSFVLDLDYTTSHSRLNDEKVLKNVLPSGYLCF